MNETIKKLHSGLITFLEEYSPLAMLILIAPFFLPVDRVLHRTLIFFICALPGVLVLFTKPSLIRKPIFIGMILFLTYFSLQDLRGLLPLDITLIKRQLFRAAMIIGPVCMLSCISVKRKFYAHAMRLIIFSAVLGFAYSLFAFYSNNLFPEIRFIMLSDSCFPHPGPSSMRSGFAVILTGVFYFHNRKKVRPSDVFILGAFSILLFAMLMSHVRTTLIGFLVVLIASLFCIRSRVKKMLYLYAASAATLIIYLFTMQLADPDEKARHMRPDGAFSAQRADTLNGRTEIWKSLLSRMDQTDWMIGKGLGRNNFVQEAPEGIAGYYKSPNGYIIHAHGGYIWALYFGGVIGLGLLLLLAGTSGISSLLAKENGSLPAALLLFCGVIFLADTHSILVGISQSAYIIFWIPVGFSMACSRKNSRQEFSLSQQDPS